MANPFDGARWPRPVLEAQLGGGVPAATTLVLNMGPGLNTATLGGATWANISDDLRSYGWHRGRASEVDNNAEPGILTVVLRNHHGNYDPTNLSGPYVSGGESLIDIGLPLRLSCTLDGVSYSRFVGFLADLELDLQDDDPTATFTIADGLETLGRTQLDVQGSLLYDGDSTGNRIGHLADEAGWPTTLRDLRDGYTLLGPTVRRLRARADA